MDTGFDWDKEFGTNSNVMYVGGQVGGSTQGRTATPPAKTKMKGNLILKATIDCKVWCDGSLLGNIKENKAYNFELEEGRHLLEFKKKEYCIDKIVDIVAGTRCIIIEEELGEYVRDPLLLVRVDDD